MNPAQIFDSLNTMTRAQLRATARKLNIRTGRNKSDSIANIASAIANQQARFTVIFTIREPGVAGSSFAPAVFQKKLRTHKPNKVTVPVS
jgi:hypothetical protein